MNSLYNSIGRSLHSIYALLVAIMYTTSTSVLVIAPTNNILLEYVVVS